jgi:hypothetical protein
MSWKIPLEPPAIRDLKHQTNVLLDLNGYIDYLMHGQMWKGNNMTDSGDSLTGIERNRHGLI